LIDGRLLVVEVVGKRLAADRLDGHVAGVTEVGSHLLEDARYATCAAEVIDIGIEDIRVVVAMGRLDLPMRETIADEEDIRSRLGR